MSMYYVSTYDPAEHLHLLEELDRESRVAELHCLFAARNFALNLRYQPKLRRRILNAVNVAYRKWHGVAP